MSKKSPITNYREPIYIKWINVYQYEKYKPEDDLYPVLGHYDAKFFDTKEEAIENRTEDGVASLMWMGPQKIEIYYHPYDENNNAMKLSAQLWNSLLEIGFDHPDDIVDAKFHIHAIQRIIQSRLYEIKGK